MYIQILSKNEPVIKAEEEEGEEKKKSNRMDMVSTEKRKGKKKKRKRRYKTIELPTNTPALPKKQNKREAKNNGNSRERSKS